MEKLKEAIKTLFDGKIDEGAIDPIMDMIELKVAEGVESKVDAEKEKVKTELTEANAIELKEYKLTLAKTIDNYLEVSVNEFVEENKPEIHSELVVESSKNALAGLVTIMKECSIDIPDSDVDVVKDLEEQVSILQKRVDTQLTENVIEKDQILEYQKAISFLKISEGLAETQKEEATTLIKEMDCIDIKTYERKLTLIIENIKGKKEKNIDESELNPKEIGTELYEKEEKGTTKADRMLDKF